MHTNQSSTMPRCDVISCRSTKQGYDGQPVVGPADQGREDTSMASPPPEFISAVNGALAVGATLVGGVSTTSCKMPKTSHAFFCYSQAVLYP
jgi:hypothetical protein